jgi:hypothetical protein
VDVRSIDGGCDGKLAHVADGASLGVDYSRPHEGGDARPVIGMLSHRSRRGVLPLYLLPRMLEQFSRYCGAQNLAEWRFPWRENGHKFEASLYTHGRIALDQLSADGRGRAVLARLCRLRDTTNGGKISLQP